MAERPELPQLAEWRGRNATTAPQFRAPSVRYSRIPIEMNWVCAMKARVSGSTSTYLEQVISANSTGSLAGVIVEPYQGASGFIFPPKGWLKRLFEWTKGNGLLFTLDEVQSSYGRTGKMWAMEHEDIQPDIVVLGKGIGSGVTVSAVCSSTEIFSCLKKGEMSSTYGGNPIANAAVIAVLEIFEKENLVEHSAQMGEYIKKGLTKIADTCKYLGDVRGRGLVMGMEFVKDKRTKDPAPDLIRAYD